MLAIYIKDTTIIVSSGSTFYTDNNSSIQCIFLITVVPAFLQVTTGLHLYSIKVVI